MSNIVCITEGRDNLKKRFANAMKHQPSIDMSLDETITSPGHALYIVYRQERGKQNYAELTWQHMMEAQRLVWERVAQILGVRLV